MVLSNVQRKSRSQADVLLLMFKGGDSSADES